MPKHGPFWYITGTKKWKEARDEQNRKDINKRKAEGIKELDKTLNEWNWKSINEYVAQQELREMEWKRLIEETKSRGKIMPERTREELNRHFRENMEGVITAKLDPEELADTKLGLETLSMHVKKAIPEMKDKIVTKTDERLWKKASVIAGKEGWESIGTYNALRDPRFTSEQKKKAYDFARKYGIDLETSVELEKLPPIVRELIGKKTEEYSLRGPEVVLTYARAIKFRIPDEYLEGVFKHAAEAKVSPNELLKNLIEKRKKDLGKNRWEEMYGPGSW
jgi:hypothetical protein